MGFSVDGADRGPSREPGGGGGGESGGDDSLSPVRGGGGGALGLPESAEARAMDGVVKVYCTHCEPNFSLPWQRKRQYSSLSSGFVISGRRILTNAHSVDYHTQVKVKRRGSDTKFLATVLAIGTECDMALLAVEDPEFWGDVGDAAGGALAAPKAISFGGLPHLQDDVVVVGYPIGGDTISVTSGVVSRIEVTSYSHGGSELLGIQIDAAINSGNSGGPVFDADGSCVGIAFQSLKGGNDDPEGIGYVIPTAVIKHFLEDYRKNGCYKGFPSLGIEWQKLENPQLRNAMRMQPGQKGVLVRRVESTCPASAKLRPRDIILSFDGHGVSNDGTVPFRSGERISFSYLISQKFLGDAAELEILRDGEVLKFSVVCSSPNRLVPLHIKGAAPSYFIVAGLVFTPVCVPYLRSEYGKDWDYDSPVMILRRMIHDMADFADQQVVVVSQVLAAEVNLGYEEVMNSVVNSVNKVPLRNLAHLASMVEECHEEYLWLELDFQDTLVLHTETAREATRDIMATHGIPAAMSADVQASLTGKAGPGATVRAGRGKPRKKPNKDRAAKKPEGKRKSEGGGNGAAASLESAKKEKSQQQQSAPRGAANGTAAAITAGITAAATATLARLDGLSLENDSDGSHRSNDL